MKLRDVLDVIEAEGWRYKSQVGSHRQFVHSIKPGKVTIAGHPFDDVPPKTLASMKQAGLK